MSIANSPRRPAAQPYAGINIAPQKARKSLIEVTRVNCLLLLIWTFWFPDPVSIGTVNLNIVPAVLLILLTLVAGGYNDALVSPRDTLRIGVMVTAACLLAALAAISMAWVDNPLRTFRVTYGEFLAVLLLFSILAIKDADSITAKIISIITLGAIVCSALACMGYAIPSFGRLMASGIDRTAGFFKHANQFGMILAMVLPVIIAQAFIKRTNIWWTTAQIVLLGAALQLTGSKTNLVVSVMIALVTLLALLKRRGELSKRPILTVGLIVFAIGIVIAGYISLDVLNPRSKMLLERFSQEGEIQSIGSRFTLWKESIRLAMASPLTGVGAGQLILTKTHSHNVFIDYFRTMGVPGLFLFSMLVWSTAALALSAIFSSLKSRNKARIDQDCLAIAYGLGIISYLLSNQLSDSFGPSTVTFFWVLVALLFVNRRSAWLESRGKPKQPVAAGGILSRPWPGKGIA